MAELRLADDPREFESARRMLLRRLAELNDRMTAAEPGTDDFLTAYNDFTRLRRMYRQVRESWTVPEDVWEVVPAGGPIPGPADPAQRSSVRTIIRRFVRRGR